MKKKKRKNPLPKVRRSWGINPKTRVKPSKKEYNRTEEKKKEKDWE
jgi:hypothetical protein